MVEIPKTEMLYGAMREGYIYGIQSMREEGRVYVVNDCYTHRRLDNINMRRPTTDQYLITYKQEVCHAPEAIKLVIAYLREKNQHEGREHRVTEQEFRTLLTAAGREVCAQCRREQEEANGTVPMQIDGSPAKECERCR